ILKGRLQLMAQQRSPKDLIQTATKLKELADMAESLEQKSDTLYNSLCGYALAIKFMAGWKGQSGFKLPEGLQEPKGRDADLQTCVESAIAVLRATLAIGIEGNERLQDDEDLSVLRQLPEYQDVLSNMNKQ
ncbi:MAG: hypothetical protein ACKN9S_06170, partial [Pirellula sp.]